MKIEFKPNFDEVLERNKLMFSKQMPNGIMAKFGVREGELPRDAFMANVPDYRKMFDDYLYFWQTKRNVLDDELPVIWPNFGVGIQGGFFGEKVTFGNGTSFCEHIMKDYSSVDDLAIDPENKYAKLILDCLDYYMEHANDRVVVGPPLTDDVGDLAYLLRGTDINLDYYDKPDDLKRLLGKLREIIIPWRETLYAKCPSGFGGYFFGWMDYHFPKYHFVSVDLFSMCSPAIYAEFGFPEDAKAIEHFGAGVVHLHTVGLHLLPEIVKLPNLFLVEISDDPNVEKRAFHIIDDIKKHTGDIPIQVPVRPGEFIEALDNGTLPGNVIYLVCEDNYADIESMTVDDVNEIMKKVRAYKTDL